MQVATTLKNVATLFVKMQGKTDYRFVFVHNGVGNVTDRKYLLRFEIDAPNGRYDINELGGLVTSEKGPLEGDFAVRTPFPFDPELIRPPFEQMQPWCEIDKNALGAFFLLLQTAKKKEENVYIEKKGMGLKRSGEDYVEYPFNIPYKLELDPHYLHLAFTESLRYGRILMYQEIRPEHGEEPKTPLVIGQSWTMCSLITPKVDPYRSYYS